MSEVDECASRGRRPLPLGGGREVRVRFVLLAAVCVLWLCAGAALACGLFVLSAGFLIAAACAACCLVGRFFGGGDES